MTTPPPALATSQVVGALGLPALIAVAYMWRVRALARRNTTISARRQAAFYAGLALIAASVLALQHLAHISMYGRETQHFLLGEIASVLIVLGLPGPMLAALVPQRTLGRLALIANPVPAFALWATDLYVWHLPGLYQPAVEHAGIGALQQFCVLVFGINMWLCLFAALPTPAWFGDMGRLFYLLTVRVTAVVLANIFLWSKVVSYPYFIHLDTARHLSPVVDENLAGAIMLVAGSALTLCLFGWLYARTRSDVLANGRHGMALGGPAEFAAGAVGRTTATVAPAPVTIAAKDRVAASAKAGHAGVSAGGPSRRRRLLRGAHAPERSR
jgi:cytochrome c oxidase assembly factor CtaG